VGLGKYRANSTQICKKQYRVLYFSSQTEEVKQTEVSGPVPINKINLFLKIKACPPSEIILKIIIIGIHCAAQLSCTNHYLSSGLPCHDLLSVLFSLVIVSALTI
jgi:hypothetical protein